MDVMKQDIFRKIILLCINQPFNDINIDKSNQIYKHDFK